MQTDETIRLLLDRTSYPGFEFEFDAEKLRVRVRCPNGTCANTGAPLAWNSRWYSLSYHMVDGEVVQTAFLAVKTAVEHETRENFRFDGVAILGPHLDLYKLLALHQTGDALTKREDKAA